ncbi:hypothetical protein [Flavobacterium sp. NKUCC04_CG]|uniref:hypothetical protein n=1 Tax=Flavobacterium sp. NKUCC04_CG TaxID=2842121 RepID=UPI001C5BCA09|nr:hypothetical protein [Flavobacterium sp. NKUCC04_CG]MBW3519523.1 hypothetical protein [Flavobacterium sp. NKUCC04_CG]
MKTNVPVHIRPHLVSFFFHEIQGKEIHYLNFRSKSFGLMFSSSLSKIIRLLLVKTPVPIKLTELKILLTINESHNQKQYSGSVFQVVSGKYHFLELPEEATEVINDLFEDIFRIAFVYYVTGHTENSAFPHIIRAINSFIDKYELLEFGFSVESLRRLYYREIKKNTKLSRLGLVSNRIAK